MINYIKKHWKLTTILAAVIVFFVFVVSGRSNNEAPPTPTLVPVPFELLNTFPPSGERQMPIANLALEFTFSKELDITSGNVKVTPFTSFEFSLGRDKKTLAIYPTTEWEYNINYKVVISIDSTDGQKLDSPIEYSFTPTKFTGSDLTE